VLLEIIIFLTIYLKQSHISLQKNVNDLQLVESFCLLVAQTSGGFLILIFPGSSLFGGSNNNGTELFESVQQSSTVIQGNMENEGL